MILTATNAEEMTINLFAICRENLIHIQFVGIIAKNGSALLGLASNEQHSRRGFLRTNLPCPNLAFGFSLPVPSKSGHCHT